MSSATEYLAPLWIREAFDNEDCDTRRTKTLRGLLTSRVPIRELPVSAGKTVQVCSTLERCHAHASSNPVAGGEWLRAKNWQAHAEAIADSIWEAAHPMERP